MKQHIKDFIVLSTIFALIILVLANPFSIVWSIAFLWAVFNVQA